MGKGGSKGLCWNVGGHGTELRGAQTLRQRVGGTGVLFLVTKFGHVCQSQGEARVLVTHSVNKQIRIPKDLIAKKW